MNIHGKKVTLRAPEPRDAAKLHLWANDPEIWQYLGGWHFPYASTSTDKWLANIDNNSQSGHVFAIDTADHGLVGTANLVSIDWKNKNAFHGMMLGDPAIRGQGYGLDTVMAMMRYAFDELGLQRLDSDIIATNTRSLNFYTTSCGWEVEGVRKNWFFRGGRHIDKTLIGITREAYQRLVADTNYWGS